ncbi:hypoxanthine phosphoribosyltransferase [bacterium]|nr:hypoxanthine phosphoribosyltransferase [bacterium]
MTDSAKVILTPFIDAAAIQRRVLELADTIAKEVHSGELLVAGVLKGGFVFTADLVRVLNRLGIHVRIDFLRVSSYGSGTVSSGTPVLSGDLSEKLNGRRVLLVDDIVDTGRTSRFVHEKIMERRPAWLRTCVLLDKPRRRVVPFDADYIGFRVPDAFIVGYGLDYDNEYRDRPELSVIRFADREPEPSFRFRIDGGTVLFKGHLDAKAAEDAGDTLLHWHTDLELDLSGMQGADRDGMNFLSRLRESLSDKGFKLSIRGMKRTLGDKQV